MERGGSSIAVFLDLTKAFNTIQHHKVLKSLSSAGVSGPLLQWFKSYLSDRKPSKEFPHPKHLLHLVFLKA